MDTSTYHYKPRRREQAGIEVRIPEICETRVRYGYQGDAAGRHPPKTVRPARKRELVNGVRSDWGVFNRKTLVMIEGLPGGRSAVAGAEQ